jgi:periplasmic divalent cation tolerance protein
MFIVVYVTVPDLKTAKRIAKGLLAKNLCACVNITKDLESFFWWQGKIDRAAEKLLIIKTRKSLFHKLKKEVRRLHPYKVAETIAMPIVAVNKEYASWIREETKDA